VCVNSLSVTVMDALDGNAGSSAADTGSHPGVADAGIASRWNQSKALLGPHLTSTVSPFASWSVPPRRSLREAS
jgi:hypothetical protein